MITKQINERVHEIQRSLSELQREILKYHRPTPKIILESEKERLAQLWGAPAALESLKKKLPTDPVAWQRKIRAEWDRRESKLSYAMHPRHKRARRTT